jgi:hypothetical protein
MEVLVEQIEHDMTLPCKYAGLIQLSLVLYRSNESLQHHQAAITSVVILPIMHIQYHKCQRYHMAMQNLCAARIFVPKATHKAVRI